MDREFIPLFTKLNPAVPKPWLFILGGLMWSAVGLMLGHKAYNWLAAVPLGWAMPLGAVGLLSALIAYRFGFAKIAEKNVMRLCLLPDKVCLFAFQSPKSYITIIMMTSLGVFLRHSPFPKRYLAVLYTTIGGALFLASLHYYTRLWRILVQKQPCPKKEP